MTGKNPGKHGIFGFTAKERETGRIVPVSAASRIKPGRVFQVHLNRPSRVGRDGHNPFRKGDALSDEVLGCAKAILAANPVRTLTLEIEGGPTPLAHARCLSRQAILVAETLRLTKSGQ